MLRKGPLDVSLEWITNEDGAAILQLVVSEEEKPKILSWEYDTGSIVADITYDGGPASLSVEERISVTPPNGMCWRQGDDDLSDFSFAVTVKYQGDCQDALNLDRSGNHGEISKIHSTIYCIL